MLPLFESIVLSTADSEEQVFKGEGGKKKKERKKKRERKETTQRSVNCAKCIPALQGGWSAWKWL